MILERLDRLAKTRTSLVEWALQHRELRVKGEFRPFGFDGHEYLRELYTEPADVVILEKAAQMGASEYGISRALHAVDTWGMTVLYLFPSDPDVEDFSNMRVRPAIARCDHLAEQCQDINNVHLRKIGAGILALRGMFSKRRVKSIPADFVIFDELDEANPANKAQAMERMSHSPWRWRMELSTPTLPDFGIDIEWQRSDQRYWHIACGGCREGVVLEDTFPDCIGVIGEGDDAEVFLRCPKCGKDRLDPCEPAVVGEYRGWIPKKPEVKGIRGYHLTQLFSTAISTREIWTTFKQTRDIAEFYNSKLGMPYAGDRMPLTADVLAACHGDWDLQRTAKDVCIGIDQGDENHVVVIKVDPNTGQRRVINAAVIEGPDPWPATLELCRLYREPRIVVDAMPDKNDARKLCEAFPGRAFMCYYSETQKDAIAVDMEDAEDAGRKVTVHRTETLDRIVDGFHWTAGGQSNGIVLPSVQVPICQLVKDHLSGIAKIKRQKWVTVPAGRQQTGEWEWVYVHVRPDHFAQAVNYANVAASLEINTARLLWI